MYHLHLGRACWVYPWAQSSCCYLWELLQCCRRQWGLNQLQWQQQPWWQWHCQRSMCCWGSAVKKPTWYLWANMAGSYAYSGAVHAERLQHNPCLSLYLNLTPVKTAFQAGLKVWSGMYGHNQVLLFVSVSSMLSAQHTNKWKQLIVSIRAWPSVAHF